MTHRVLGWLHRDEGGLGHGTEAVLAARAGTQRLAREHSHSGQHLARVGARPLRGHQPTRCRCHGRPLSRAGHAAVPGEVEMSRLEAHGDGVSAGVVVRLLGEGGARPLRLRGRGGVRQGGQGLAGVRPGGGPRVTRPSERSFIRTSLSNIYNS